MALWWSLGFGWVCQVLYLLRHVTLHDGPQGAPPSLGLGGCVKCCICCITASSAMMSCRMAEYLLSQRSADSKPKGVLRGLAPAAGFQQHCDYDAASIVLVAAAVLGI